MANFSAQIQSEKNIYIDYILMCISEVQNHFKLVLSKTQIIQWLIVRQSGKKIADFRAKL